MTLSDQASMSPF